MENEHLVNRTFFYRITRLNIFLFLLSIIIEIVLVSAFYIRDIASIPYSKYDGPVRIRDFFIVHVELTIVKIITSLRLFFHVASHYGTELRRDDDELSWFGFFTNRSLNVVSELGTIVTCIYFLVHYDKAEEIFYTINILVSYFVARSFIWLNYMMIIICPPSTLSLRDCVTQSTSSKIKIIDDIFYGLMSSVPVDLVEVANEQEIQIEGQMNQQYVNNPDNDLEGAMNVQNNPVGFSNDNSFKIVIVELKSMIPDTNNKDGLLVSESLALGQGFELKLTEDCPICMDKFLGEDRYIKLQCNHIFHSKCIIRWLNIKKVCPVCKREVVIVTPSHCI